MSFLCGSVSKVSSCNSGNPDFILESGRSLGEENNNPLQYSCLGNPMDRGVWSVTVHEVTKVRRDIGTETPPFLIWSNIGWSWPFSLSLSFFSVASFFVILWLCILISFWQTCWSHSTFVSDSYSKDKVHMLPTFHILQKSSPFFIWFMPEDFLSHMHLFYCNILSPSECETLTDRDLTWFVQCSLLRFQKGVHLCRNTFYKTQRISGEIKAE